MVVSDSGPIIWLSRINQFQLLKQLFHEVVIPQAVKIEVVDNATGHPCALNVIRACQEGWLKANEVKDTQKVALLCADLHTAESEAIVITEELAAQALLIDERKARHIASVAEIPIIGTVGILLLAHQRGTQVDLKALLDQMRQDGFRLSEKVYQEILSREVQ